ncbi:MAG TPA: hypothetical protein VEZ70_01180 [Allosphingosinicella sp.]|nr:hypothetical protein [Allosphingosinicella sp.]
MNNPPLWARVAALTFAFLNLFGLMFFGGYYFSPEHRSDLLIYGFPTVALVVAGVAPNRWYRIQPARSILALLAVIALPPLAVAIHSDIALINGADRPAAFLRSVQFLLLLLFVLVAVSAPRERT